MRKVGEFILSIFATLIFMIGCWLKFIFLFFKYSIKGLIKAYNQSLKEGYDSLDKGF